jgi:hypothetical protein
MYEKGITRRETINLLTIFKCLMDSDTGEQDKAVKNVWE